MLPRAPESAIILIGLKSSSDVSIALETFFVDSSQILTTLAYLSFSVNRPRWKFFSTFNTSASAFARISFLADGICISNTDVVIAPIVEYLKPVALILSRTCAVAVAS